jgi:sugar phosphate isomerase/epimerase
MAAAFFLAAGAATPADLPGPFFAMQTATKDAAHESADAQVQLVKSLSFDGIGAVSPEELAAFAVACDRHGVRLWNTYLTLEIDGPAALDPRLKQSLAPLKGRNAMLWVALTSKKHRPSATNGDAEAVRLVNELADLAESLGTKVAIYPHTWFWIERVEDAVRVADQVNRASVGVTFNLCHFLKVDDESRLEQALRHAMHRLFVVSLNGAESGRAGADWKELIQTLDRGSFDNLRLLHGLREIGFTGPIGFQGYGIGGNAEDNLRRTIAAWRDLKDRLVSTTPDAGFARLGFAGDGRGGFTFDTGELRGRLHAEGKSIGLSEVVHPQTGARLDRSNGLLSHYRVFTRGVRYGAGAWDWPSTATLKNPTSVEIHWPPAEGRPFTLRALYRLLKADTIEVETIVEPAQDLTGFESFLASYFDPAFSNACVTVKTNDATTTFAATRERGDWQMYPRDTAARALIEDGRWTIEPHPVAWTFPAEFAGPALAQRRAPTLALAGILQASATDCFAVAIPHQTDEHYSIYLSLFGRDLKAAETVRAKARLTIQHGEVR